jgi:hypothetical protein
MSAVLASIARYQLITALATVATPIGNTVETIMVNVDLPIMVAHGRLFPSIGALLVVVAFLSVACLSREISNYFAGEQLIKLHFYFTALLRL